MRRILSVAVIVGLLSVGLITAASAQEFSASPTSLSFSNTYVGKATGSKVVTITNISTGTVII